MNILSDGKSYRRISINNLIYKIRGIIARVRYRQNKGLYIIHNHNASVAAQYDTAHASPPLLASGKADSLANAPLFR